MRVSVEGLTVRYGATLAVDGATCEAHPGQILGVIGPNGSGKSSLVKAVAGVTPAGGRVSFDGGSERPRAIGYMAQDIAGRTALTVMEVVLLGRLGRLGLRVDPADLAVVSLILADLDLTRFAGRQLGELSGGQRQIVYLAQALAAEPRILLLDEPISALDLRHQLEVLALVRRLTLGRGLTTICVLHDLNATARFADRIALMREGRLIACGAPADILTTETIARAFEVEASIAAGVDGYPVVTALRPAMRRAAE